MTYSQFRDIYINQEQGHYYVNMLDRLLAQALASIIKEKFGSKTYQKIETRLLERYNLSVLDAVRDFQKLDATLREFFGPGADAMEKDFLEHLISLDTSKRGKPWIVVENQDLTHLILQSFGDKEKKLILDTAFSKPGVILDILDKCDIPKSSGYRIINELVNDGLLAEKGFTTTADGKKVGLYTSLFENIRIDIMEGKVTVRIQLREDILKESYLLKILLGQ